MTTFTKYSSIENSYRQAFLDKCALKVGYEKMVALEKIHGANFSWIVTKDTIRVAKRSGFIEDGESFYGHLRFYNKYKPIVKALFDVIANEFNITQINLYGEIFGGRYNGVTEQSAKKVQDGVNYHPDNEFMAFDLRVTFGDGVSAYVPFSSMKEYIEDANFLSRKQDKLLIAPVIATGTLEELIKIDPLFYTLVPVAYGLDTSHTKTNADYAEGFVIRGYHDDFYVGNERVILKQKNALYGEKEKEVKIKTAISLTDDQQSLLDKICSYVNENRVRAVASKDTYDIKSFGRLQGDVTRDALDDFFKDEGFKATEHPDWGVIAKRVGSHVALVIRPIWVNMHE